MDFGISVDVGAGIGIGSGFGSQEATAAIGGLMDAGRGIDAPNRDVTGLPDTLPDERSLMEKAAGWVVDKAAAKVNAILENPITTALNAAFGMVPVAGPINSISGLLGGPTIGGIATAAGRAIANGDVTPGIAVDVDSAIGNAEPPEHQGARQSIKYFRYRDGRIESRIIDNYAAPIETPAAYEAYSGGVNR